MGSDIAKQVQEYSVSAREFSKKWYGSEEVAPKRVIIKETSQYVPPELNLRRDSEFTFNGVLLPTSLETAKKRTVFDPNPVEINGNPRYVSYKGFGENGHEMYLGEHSDGDVSFGMYLKEAEKEFSHLLQCFNWGFNVAVPLAICIIPRSEYFRCGLTGLNKIIKVSCMADADFCSIESIGPVGYVPIRSASEKTIPSLKGLWQKVDDLSKQNESDLQALNSKNFDDKSFYRRAAEFDKCSLEILDCITDTIVNELDNCYRAHGEGAFINLAEQLRLGDKVKAFASGEDVGAVIKASKSPLRVCDAGADEYEHNPNGNEDIAYEIGKIVAGIAGKGLFHKFPFPFNWTTAGELEDGEDIVQLFPPGQLQKTHQDELRENFRDYITYIFNRMDGYGYLDPFMKGVLEEN